MDSWCRITDEAPDDRDYESGEVVNLGSNGAIWKDRGWAVPAEPPSEHKRGTLENAATRTSKPGWVYQGNGWWKAPSGDKVRGPEDADQDELEARLES